MDIQVKQPKWGGPDKVPELVPHYTWDIKDSSKLVCAMGCQRRYFFEYVLGWRPEAPNLHLEFGRAWHKAMDYLFLNGCTPENHEGAYKAFLDTFRLAFGPGDEEEDGVKTSANAHLVLKQYIDTYRHDEWEVIHGAEIPGEVYITDEWAITFRLDLPVRNKQGRVVVIDHKTTMKGDASWRNQFILSLQLGTYIHGANSVFGWENVEGALINAVMLRKPIKLKKDGEPYANMKGSEFVRIPVAKSKDQMMLWLDTARYWYNEVEESHRMLEGESPDTHTMRTFPCNFANCTAHNGTCPYLAFCSARSNPLTLVQQYAEGVPIGFERRYWDPTKDEEGE